MKRWGPQRIVRLDEKEFETDLEKGNFIFVGSSCDMFAEGIPERWIMETLIHCSKFDNSYFFQTKNPGRVLYLTEWPEKSIFCTTIETNRWYIEMQRSPLPSERADAMNGISVFNKTYVTIEPIMDFDLKELIHLIAICNPQQVNIGADSGGNKLPEPTPSKVRELIEALEEFTTVKQKKNLKRLWKE
jgi:DNA repair photolyase